MSGQVVAVVTAIIGEAVAVDEDGNERRLQVGDEILAGERVVGDVVLLPVSEVAEAEEETLIEPTAMDDGESGGSSFVIIDRINEPTEAVDYEYGIFDSDAPEISIVDRIEIEDILPEEDESTIVFEEPQPPVEVIAEEPEDPEEPEEPEEPDNGKYPEISYVAVVFENGAVVKVGPYNNVTINDEAFVESIADTLAIDQGSNWISAYVKGGSDKGNTPFDETVFVYGDTSYDWGQHMNNGGQIVEQGPTEVDMPVEVVMMTEYESFTIDDTTFVE